MVSVHNLLEKFGNTIITGHFCSVLEENPGRELTCLTSRLGFRKAPFSKCFTSTLTRKPASSIFFKFLRFEERFPKAPFSQRISVDGRPIRGSMDGASVYYNNKYCLYIVLRF